MCKAGINMRYILASGSPRRKELLAKVITEFEIIPAVGDEVTTKSEPAEVVGELSFQKASEIFHKILTEGNGDFVVIGADTIVSYNHRVLGKPSDRQDAENMLHELSGQVHEVYTGVTVFSHIDNEDMNFTFTECTGVRVSCLSDKEIRDYVSCGECDDKAGAYAIQGEFSKFIEGIDGDYFNVVGLPVAGLYRELKNHKLLFE